MDISSPSKGNKHKHLTWSRSGPGKHFLVIIHHGLWASCLRLSAFSPSLSISPSVVSLPSRSYHYLFLVLALLIVDDLLPFFIYLFSTSIDDFGTVPSSSPPPHVVGLSLTSFSGP